jgi:hypothetical protein
LKDLLDPAGRFTLPARTNQQIVTRLAPSGSCADVAKIVGIAVDELDRVVAVLFSHRDRNNECFSAEIQPEQRVRSVAVRGNDSGVLRGSDAMLVVDFVERRLELPRIPINRKFLHHRIVHHERQAEDETFFGDVLRLENTRPFRSVLGMRVSGYQRSGRDPSKTETFRAGIGVRALALDSKGNAWVASNMSLDFPPPVIPDGASIMEQFKIAAGHMLKVLETNPKMVTGVVNMIRPDGSQPAPMGFTGNKAVSVPWGLNIDGNDDVWIGNFWGRGVVLMAGDNTTSHPAGTKTGDAIHVFRGGSIQMLTDVSIDAAGDVWAANNWNDLNAAAAPDPLRPTSTWGGGSGITVIYGVAGPVKPPRMGKVQRY